MATMLNLIITQVNRFRQFIRKNLLVFLGNPFGFTFDCHPVWMLCQNEVFFCGGVFHTQYSLRKSLSLSQTTSLCGTVSNSISTIQTGCFSQRTARSYARDSDRVTYTVSVSSTTSNIFISMHLLEHFIIFNTIVQ